MLRAAQAGRVGRQYPSEEARAEAIDVGAGRPPAVIRADAHRSVRECLTAVREHPSQLWDAPAIWLRAGRRPVRGVVPSLRGELEYHHVDLAAGYQPADWPGDFVATELSRVTDLMDRHADAPPMTLTGLAMLRIRTSPPVDVTGPRPRCWPGWPVAVTAAAWTRTARPCRPSRRWRNPAREPHCQDRTMTAAGQRSRRIRIAD
jgi:maleylpyruvate isomerase